jgi:hypothetical protein
MLLLDHVGAKSGKRRTTPLTYLHEDEKLVIVASSEPQIAAAPAGSERPRG